MVLADYFLLKKTKMGAGRPEPGPGQLQERLGGGRQTSDRSRLQKLSGALQKARSPWRQVRRKILRNKHPPSSNRCPFIHTFASEKSVQNRCNRTAGENDQEGRPDMTASTDSWNCYRTAMTAESEKRHLEN
jgi:hypothetical protein